MKVAIRRTLQISVIGLALLVTAGAFALLYMRPHRVNSPLNKLTYAIYCINNRYEIRTTPLDQLSSRRGKVCKVNSTDHLIVAEEKVNDLGGVGAPCSCDKKLREYCLNGRRLVSELPPGEVHQQYGRSICELDDAEEADKPYQQADSDRADKLQKSYKPDATNACKCPVLGGDEVLGEERGDELTFLVLSLLILVLTFLFFLRLRQRAEPPEDFFNKYPKL